MDVNQHNKTTLGFNPASPTVMHIDLNSCFATIEQQANPFLRNKPVAVAAYDTPNGCILAASYEAKRCGVQGVETGMRVKDGKKLCPRLVHEREHFVVAEMRPIIEVGDADGQAALKRQLRGELKLNARHGGKDRVN